MARATASSARLRTPIRPRGQRSRPCPSSRGDWRRGKARALFPEDHRATIVTFARRPDQDEPAVARSPVRGLAKLTTDRTGLTIRHENAAIPSPERLAYIPTNRRKGINAASGGWMDGWIVAKCHVDGATVRRVNADVGGCGESRAVEVAGASVGLDLPHAGGRLRRGGPSAALAAESCRAGLRRRRQVAQLTRWMPERPIVVSRFSRHADTSVHVI